MTSPRPLEYRLIVTLSGFGLVMALATVWVVPPNVEPLLWLPIFVTCAVLIARRAPGRPFLHGFLVSLANCVWITSAHMAFSTAYLANHPAEAESLAKMPAPDSPRLMMLMMGPAIGVVSGLVLGGFAVLAAKLMRTRETVRS